MEKKQKFSAAQKRAYYSGQGYKLAQNGKKIDFKNADNLASFIAGYKSVDPKKYPNK